MYQLNDEQIEFIRNDLVARGVETEDLQLNLLDHICCVIECELDEDGDFEQFYATAIKRFYKKELREIQEETNLLLTFKHYYAMKKTMIISGILTAIAFTAGTIFKFYHWPGASVLFVLGFVFFAFLFLPLMFVLKMREKPDTRNKTVLVIGMILGIVTVLSVLFKIMHWPGASILMFGSIGILGLLFIPVYFFTGIRNPAYKFNTIVTSVLLIAGAGMLMSLVSIKPSWTYQKMQVQSDEWLRSENISLNKVLMKLENNLVKDSSSTEIGNVINLSNLLCGKIEELNMKIATKVNEGQGDNVDWEAVTLSNNYDIVDSTLFLVASPGEETPIKKIRNYCVEFEKLALKNGVEISIVDDNIEMYPGKKEGWENVQFRNNTASVAVRKLMLLQTQVRTAELDLLMKLK